jgi:hypothetical protein
MAHDVWACHSQLRSERMGIWILYFIAKLALWKYKVSNEECMYVVILRCMKRESASVVLQIHCKGVCVWHHGLAIFTLKGILRQEKNYEKTPKYFTMQKHNLQ